MDTNYDYLFKMILIGDSGVGKTCLISRYIKNQFDLQAKTTIGVQFLTKSINYQGKTLSTQIWDTAGAQRYRAMTSAYYKGASAAFIVYDITRPATFASIPRWIEQIDQVASKNTVIMIIGNKSDLNYERKVSTKEGVEMARKFNCFFIETSALDMVNVEEAFVRITHSLYDNLKMDLDSGSGTGTGGIIDLQPAFKSEVFKVKNQKGKCCC